MTDPVQPEAITADTSDDAQRGDVVTSERMPEATPSHETTSTASRPQATVARVALPSGADAVTALAASPQDTAGGMIRTAREAQGIDLASLAAMLKIPLRKLEALEEGRHADLPGHTFERALAQAACRVLKLDPKPVLGLLPQVGANTLEQMGGGINQPFRESAHGDFGEPASFLRPGFLVPVLIVLAALALFLVPSDLLSRLPKFGLGGGDAASVPLAQPSTSASAPSSTTSVVLPGVGEAKPDAVNAAAPSDRSTLPAPAGATTAAPLAASAPGPSSSAASIGVDEVLAHPETPPSIPVQVMAAADSWIEVTDAQGHVLLSRTVIAGESVGLDGPLPMKVKIGNARGTRLSLRGENVDLEPWTHDNIARLELK